MADFWWYQWGRADWEITMVNQEQTVGLIRHVITFIGGILVARGKLDVGSVETISGLVVTVVGFLFSFLAPEKAAPKV
jgi:hypothetical protein